MPSGALIAGRLPVRCGLDEGDLSLILAIFFRKRVMGNG
jgi:hypothetical protein